MLTTPNRSDRTISAIAFDAGFGDLSHFNRLFRRRFGATPSEVRAETLRSSRLTELDADGSALGKSGGEG
jgi:AraC-like DNA-binding protein